MPEGDTLHKVAGALRPLLLDEAIRSLWLRDRGELVDLKGVVVEEVVALGKHLLVALGPRHVFHGHLGMGGKWFHAAPGVRRRGAVAQIETRQGSVACVNAPVAEVIARLSLASHPVLARLGPDLLAEEIDFARVVARARRSEARVAADLLLDQRVACGIGNVYKSEVLFVEGVHPWTPAAVLSDEQVEALFRCARELLQRNLGGWKRTTVAALRPGDRWPEGSPRVFVYGRNGETCLRCRGPIAARRQGDAARTTYWCPRCQPAQYAIDGRYAPRGSW